MEYFFKYLDPCSWRWMWRRPHKTFIRYIRYIFKVVYSIIEKGETGGRERDSGEGGGAGVWEE
jgi:hypothetical protein